MTFLGYSFPRPGPQEKDMDSTAHSWERSLSTGCIPQWHPCSRMPGSWVARPGLLPWSSERKWPQMVTISLSSESQET
jgi:hypothetical protein